MKTGFGRAAAARRRHHARRPDRRVPAAPTSASATTTRRSASSRRAARTSSGPGRRCTRSRSPPQTSTWRSTPRTRSANQRRHRARRGHQGPAQHRPHRPDPLPRLASEPLRLPVRREAPDRARDGLLHLHPARAHRQLRGAAATDAASREPADRAPTLVSGISINDLRKNLRDLNEHMDQECRSSAARYGIVLDASLITGIDPPPEVESALAAINTAHNHVSSRHQPGAGRGRPEDRAVASAPSRSRPSRRRPRSSRCCAGRAARRAQEAAARGALHGLPAQRAARPVQQGAAA